MRSLGDENGLRGLSRVSFASATGVRLPYQGAVVLATGRGLARERRANARWYHVSTSLLKDFLQWGRFFVC